MNWVYFIVRELFTVDKLAQILCFHFILYLRNGMIDFVVIENHYKFSPLNMRGYKFDDDYFLGDKATSSLIKHRPAFSIMHYFSTEQNYNMIFQYRTFVFYITHHELST